MMDAMRNDFGVGFRGESVAEILEVSAQRFVIFDDAVVHDRDAVARYVRMGIFGGRHAMGGPARMRNADRAADGVCVEGVLQRLDLAHGAQARRVCP